MANATQHTAGPDLLAACKLAQARLEIEARNWDVGGEKILRTDAYRDIVAAIARAEGGDA